MAKNTERFFHSRLALTEGVPVRNVVDFPLNKLYTMLRLRISATVTVGSAPTNYVAATNPILALIRNIMFKVSKDGISYNVPGAAAYMLAAMKMGKLPRIDNASFNPNSAAAYAMSVDIPLLFVDPLMARPEDTILDMSRHTMAELYVQIGAATDCLKAGVGSGGTFALSGLSCDIEYETLAGAPRDTVRPLFFQQVTVEGSPKNVASETSALFTRSSDRLLKRVMFATTNGGAVSRPYSGVASSAVVDEVSFGDGRTYFDKSRKDEQIQDEFQTSYTLDAQTGLYVLDYVKDGSNFSAIPTGDKAELKLEYTVDGSAPAGTNILSPFSETLNALKA